MWAAARTHKWLLLGAVCLAVTLLIAAPLLAKGLRQQPSLRAIHLHPLGSGSGGSSGSGSSSGSSRDSNTPGSTAVCAYGALPGTWVDGAAAGSHWHLLSPTCQLSNLLAQYTAESAQRSLSPDLNPSDGPVDAMEQHQQEQQQGQQQQQQQVPPLRILLLSDSVDRFILQHWCGHLGGVKHTEIMKAIPAAEVQVSRSEQQEQQPGDQQQQPSKHRPLLFDGMRAVRQQQQPSSLNKTAYAFHTCFVPGLPSFRLAASYFPGVHPSGPYHRNLQQSYRQRIDAVQAMWAHYASGDPPDLISVASLLWDVARMRLHEAERASAPQLAAAVLEEWVGNFTEVVQYARRAFPQTKLWVTHTSLPPRHDPITGIMSKPYLGRRYYISQLNAAAKAAAAQLGLQLVDYRQVGDRFLDGQSYLDDLIHPNELVGLELANIYLNLAHQQLAAEGRLNGSRLEAGTSGSGSESSRGDSSSRDTSLSTHDSLTSSVSGGAGGSASEGSKESSHPMAGASSATAAGGSEDTLPAAAAPADGTQQAAVPGAGHEMPASDEDEAKAEATGTADAAVGSQVLAGTPGSPQALPAVTDAAADAEIGIGNGNGVGTSTGSNDSGSGSNDIMEARHVAMAGRRRRLQQHLSRVPSSTSLWR